jgi:hypothetical protein
MRDEIEQIAKELADDYAAHKGAPVSTTDVLLGDLDAREIETELQIRMDVSDYDVALRAYRDRLESIRKGDLS